MISKMKLNEKGFTLIELCIVCAIIGILAAISMPSYKKYRTNASNTQAQSLVKNTEMACMSCWKEGCSCSDDMGIIRCTQCIDPTDNMKPVLLYPFSDIMMEIAGGQMNNLEISAYSRYGSTAFCIDNSQLAGAVREVPNQTFMEPFPSPSGICATLPSL